MPVSRRQFWMYTWKQPFNKMLLPPCKHYYEHVNWCFTPSQPVWLDQGDNYEHVIQTNVSTFYRRTARICSSTDYNPLHNTGIDRFVTGFNLTVQLQHWAEFLRSCCFTQAKCLSLHAPFVSITWQSWQPILAVCFGGYFYCNVPWDFLFNDAPQ